MLNFDLEKIEFPKIVVMNIDPENINNCIRENIHGVRINSGAVGSAENLNKGDICLIRRTSGKGRYEYGVVGIWYYDHKEDIEGQLEELWIPPNGWKFKIFMKPLVREFEEIFNEDFTVNVPDQLKHKFSSKVDGLKQIDIESAVVASFHDSTIPKRYLRAIIEEKRNELGFEKLYEDSNGFKWVINIFEFLNDLTNDIYNVKLKINVRLKR